MYRYINGEISFIIFSTILFILTKNSQGQRVAFKGGRKADHNDMVSTSTHPSAT